MLVNFYPARTVVVTDILHLGHGLSGAMAGRLKNLCVTLESVLTFDEHVNREVWVCIYVAKLSFFEHLILRTDYLAEFCKISH